jgi:hypothetical protein
VGQILQCFGNGKTHDDVGQVHHDSLEEVVLGVTLHIVEWGLNGHGNVRYFLKIYGSYLNNNKQQMVQI